MVIRTIKNLAYDMIKAKEKSQPQPIFFLGAGASKTGNIPLAKEIAADILAKHPNHPTIINLNSSEQTYAKLMECLSADERSELLIEYIKDSKINVTHIYLAQLLYHGFVDYVLTVNFDNLMLRALALYNEFPPTHDMAILKDFTTTTIGERSVVYLHGQHQGLWQLNTTDELNKVKEIVIRIFDSIKSKRPWVIIGYSGSDPVFEHIKKLGRFDNGLYWVGYKDDEPSKDVKDFLNTPNTNAHYIKGYDADSFMLKLNELLGLDQPNLLDKPFSSLKTMLEGIIDINDENHFRGVKERLEMAKRDVEKAITQFEEKKPIHLEQNELKIDKLKKEIISLLISERYGEIKQFEAETLILEDPTLTNLVAEVYNNWGIYLANLAYTKSGEEAENLFQQAFEKYQKATLIKPDFHQAFYNWGTGLGNLAKTKSGKEAENLYQQAFEKFQKAIEIKPDFHLAFNNWGNTLTKLAKIKSGEEAEDLYQQAFEKYQKAIEIKPDFHLAFNNRGNALTKLAKIKSGEEAENLYQQAFEKYQKAIEIKPDFQEAFSNWGYNLGNLAETKSGEEAEALYQQAFEKFQKAIVIKHNCHETFNNWGVTIVKLALCKSGKEAENLYQQAFEKYQKAIEYGGSSYNLSCLFALKGEHEQALKYLDICLTKKEIEVDFVLKDDDWKDYLQDEDFIALINKHKK